MIVTEEEAKTKRCQESFPAADALSPVGSTEAVAIPIQTVNYPSSFHGGFAAGGSMTYARHTAPTNCIGSACMAWRWDKGSSPNVPDPWIPDDVPLAKIPLSARTENCLKHNNLLTAGDVRECSPASLLRIPNFGRACLKEVMDVIGLAVVGKGYCGKAGKP
jgi:hypothetical protein